MRKILSSAMALAILGLAAPAMAGGSAGSIGVGGEFTLAGMGGASVNYDAGMFHVGGFFSYRDNPGPSDTETDVGGRFYYHIHSTAMSDFSVGGQLGMQLLDFENNDDDATIVEIDLGGQIRAFVASNVALSFGLGIGIFAADGEGLLVTGDITGVAGVHYYFF